ncbi:MAG: hypothetical protein IJW63_07665 [Lachnospiraceae bacterium]|nr:hypothetical protein [Lachnospiraceae bacterium]
MFKFHLYNGTLTVRMFVALTVAICIWSILTLTGEAMVVSEESHHVHQGDEVSGGVCYEAIYHEHSGSKSSGGGCYGKAVKHAHTGSSNTGGGCYGKSIFHSHTGSSGQGGGCYGSAVTHSHSGSSSQGGGCYGKAIYHSHSGNETEGGACYATPIYHQHQGEDETATPNGCYTKTVVKNVGPVCGIFADLGDETWKCGGCGWVIPNWNVPADRQHWPQVLETRYTLGCGLIEGALERYTLTCSLGEDTVQGYELSCGKSSGTVEWYQLSCGKNESTVEAFELNCGYSEGQVEAYKRNCGMTGKTIVGYKLVCDLEVNVTSEDVIQPVKVPIKEEEPVQGLGTEVPDGMKTGQEDGAEVLDGMKTGQEDGAEVPDGAETVKEDGAEVPDGVKIGLADGAATLRGAEIVKEDEVQVGASEERVPTTSVMAQSEPTDLQMAKLQLGSVQEKSLVALCLFAAVCVLGIWLYFKKTVALFYYDETNHYHSLGRITFRRTQKGYHVEIGNGIRKKASTDRYRIRTTKNMQKAAEKQHLYVKISTQIMKLGLEEYVDFAL